MSETPITNHQSPITGSKSPVTGSEIPITNHQSPVTGSDAPVTSHQSPVTASGDADADEISLLDLLIVLAKHKRIILGLPLIAGVFAAIYSLLLPNIYTATTKILPPQHSQSSAPAMLGQLGALAGVAGASLGIKNPNELYVSMLKSRTVADGLIQRFELQKLYEQETLTGARLALQARTAIASGRDGMITIEVDDKDSKHAADLANAYVDELYKLTQSLAVTEASQRRLFFERQFVQAKDNLAKAELGARKALQQGGLVKVDEQGRAMVETTARLRAQISLKQVQMGAMRAFATAENPDLRLAQQELESMKRELAKIEGTGGIQSAANETRGKGIDNVGLLRDMKYHEIIYELLAKQFEMAKIDEAKESSLLQVLDAALVPERKTKPSRSRIVLLTSLVALIAAMLGAFILEGISKVRADPRQAERLQALRRHSGWR